VAVQVKRTAGKGLRQTAAHAQAVLQSLADAVHLQVGRARECMPPPCSKCFVGGCVIVEHTRGWCSMCRFMWGWVGGWAQALPWQAHEHMQAGSVKNTVPAGTRSTPAGEWDRHAHVVAVYPPTPLSPWALSSPLCPAVCRTQGEACLFALAGAFEQEARAAEQEGAAATGSRPVQLQDRGQGSGGPNPSHQQHTSSSEAAPAVWQVLLRLDHMHNRCVWVRVKLNAPLPFSQAPCLRSAVTDRRASTTNRLREGPLQQLAFSFISPSLPPLLPAPLPN